MCMWKMLTLSVGSLHAGTLHALLCRTLGLTTVVQYNVIMPTATFSLDHAQRKGCMILGPQN